MNTHAGFASLKKHLAEEKLARAAKRNGVKNPFRENFGKPKNNVGGSEAARAADEIARNDRGLKGLRWNPRP